MTAIIDIVSSVVTALRVPFASQIGAKTGTYVYTFTTPTVISHRLYEGQRMKLTEAGGTVHYGTIKEIIDNLNISCTFPDNFTLAGSEIIEATIEMICPFHYGHRLEIVNRFAEITRHATAKRGMFPTVLLFTDIEEKISGDGYDREAELNLVIMTDTKPSYSSVERKAATFDPILQPLYELLIDRMKKSTYIAEVSPAHSKYDRYYWGKNGLYGNTGNMFNDYIDAIEIDNLKLHTFKNC